MVVAMGHRWFGSKAASGLWQALVALMPPHAVYIETHLGGGAVMKRKPGALRNIRIDLDARALASFECDYPVELVHADCHAYLGQFPFDGWELVYSDPPYLHGTRKSSRRYRYDYEDADHVALLELLKGLPCAAMVSGYPSELYEERLDGWGSVSLQVMNQAGVGTPKGRLTKLEKAFVGKPWRQVRDSVEVKLLAEDGELYVLAQSRARVLK